MDNPSYNSWRGMRERCNNPNHDSYKYYGGRGIKVCERWDNFYTFAADMGPKPAGFTIERIDNNGNYEPNNCKWIPRSEQSANRQYRLTSYPNLVRHPTPVTHCKRGHELTPENTYVYTKKSDAKGHRSCRTCTRIRMHDYHQMRKAQHE